jgi:hypothetical protein
MVPLIGGGWYADVFLSTVASVDGSSATDARPTVPSLIPLMWCQILLHRRPPGRHRHIGYAPPVMMLSPRLSRALWVVAGRQPWSASSWIKVVLVCLILVVNQALRSVTLRSKCISARGGLVTHFSHLHRCPVCSRDLAQFGSSEEQEAHVRSCLEGGSGATTQSAKYLVYKLPPESILIGTECVICLEEFTKGRHSRRLFVFIQLSLRRFHGCSTELFV